MWGYPWLAQDATHFQYHLLLALEEAAKDGFGTEQSEKEFVESFKKKMEKKNSQKKAELLKSKEELKKAPKESPKEPQDIIKNTQQKIMDNIIKGKETNG